MSHGCPYGWENCNVCRPKPPAGSFGDTATLIAEGIEDHTRGEVENLTRAIEGEELLHVTFIRRGKRYRIEMREE